jgi:DNA-binding GntR family transcriptional regulator
MTALSQPLADAPSKRPTLVDDAYRALKAAIWDNVFPPGYQGSEQEIANQLAMSRTPVHEAIIRLQEEGLVRVLAKRGVVVTSIAPEDMREIYDVIIALEAMAAELLASMKPSERSRIADDLDRETALMEEALAQGDMVAWANADDRFHRLLVERCGNSRIRRMTQTVADQSHRTRMLTLKLRPQPTNSVAEHRRIAGTIREGNAVEAHDCARRHRMRARDELIPLLIESGIRHL